MIETLTVRPEPAADAFGLEPPPSESSPVPSSTIEELRRARVHAKDIAAAYAEAIKFQSEKYKVKPGALKRYIAALCDDKVDDAEAEAKDLERLIG